MISILKTLREKKGVTQSQLASALNITQPRVVVMEKTNEYNSHYKELAEYFEVDESVFQLDKFIYYCDNLESYIDRWLKYRLKQTNVTDMQESLINSLFSEIKSLTDSLSVDAVLSAVTKEEVKG